jgi:hypothetical protein
MTSTIIDVSTRRAGIVGVSGYSGMELARILASHPYFSLGLVTSDKWAGKRSVPVHAGRGFGRAGAACAGCGRAGGGLVGRIPAGG